MQWFVLNDTTSGRLHLRLEWLSLITDPDAVAEVRGLSGPPSRKHGRTCGRPGPWAGCACGGREGELAVLWRVLPENMPLNPHLLLRQLLISQQTASEYLRRLQG